MLDDVNLLGAACNGHGHWNHLVLVRTWSTGTSTRRLLRIWGMWTEQIDWASNCGVKKPGTQQNHPLTANSHTDWNLEALLHSLGSKFMEKPRETLNDLHNTGNIMKYMEICCSCSYHHLFTTRLQPIPWFSRAIRRVLAHHHHLCVVADTDLTPCWETRMNADLAWLENYEGWW